MRARVEGVLQSVHFAEGRRVNKGDLLYIIDPRQYDAALQQARARLAQAEADLTRYGAGRRTLQAPRLASTRAQLPSLQQESQLAEDRLSVLLGRPLSQPWKPKS